MGFFFNKPNKCSAGSSRQGSRCVRHTPPDSHKVKVGDKCKLDGLSRCNPNDKALKPIIARPGGKTQLADRIIKKMRPHRVYNEPFVGGGAVFLKKPLAQKNYINDKDKDVIKTYKAFKNSSGFNKCDLTPSRRRFNRIKVKVHKSACDVAYLNKLSFGSGGKAYGGEKKFNRRRSDIGIKYQKAHKNEYKEKLKNTTITSEDFRKAMKRADSKETVHFLDPPYVKGSEIYKEKGVTPKEVCDTARQMKGQVILTYDNNPEVRKHCSKGFKMQKVSTRYTLSANSNNKASKELLMVKN